MVSLLSTKKRLVYYGSEMKVEKTNNVVYTFMTKYKLIIFIAFAISSCKTKDYKSDLQSDQVIKINEACFQLGETKDTSSVKLLLTHIKDPRVTNYYKYKGLSVYYCRITALKKISGDSYYGKITNEIDTNAINFYLRWAFKNKLINDMTDIQLD